MAVAASTWKFIGKTTLGGSAAISDTLDAIHALFDANAYDDGTARTPGSGIAWDSTKITDSGTKGCYLTPSSAASSTGDNIRVIFAGHTSTISNFPLYNHSNFPTHTGDGSTQHTWSNSYLFGAMAKNAGSFSSLSPGADTTPFSSGGFTGFVRIADENCHANGILYAYECLDGIFLIFQDGSSGTGDVQVFCAGGLLDPGSDDSLDSEADELLYSMHTSGNSGIDVLASSSATVFPCHSTGNNAEIAVAFSPGASTYTLLPLSINSATENNGSGGQTAMHTRSGKYALEAITFSHFYDIGGTRHFMGRWREIFMGTRGNSGQEINSGGSVVAYLVAYRGPGQGLGRSFLLKA